MQQRALPMGCWQTKRSTNCLFKDEIFRTCSVCIPACSAILGAVFTRSLQMACVRTTTISSSTELLTTMLIGAIQSSMMQVFRERPRVPCHSMPSRNSTHKNNREQILGRSPEWSSILASNPARIRYMELHTTCLLYTSDAADERSSVDLGGRRII